MTYADALIDYGWRYGPSCHLIGDSIVELEDMARRIRLEHHWRQLSRARHKIMAFLIC
jgi:hypothetical protein